ncbi:MAG: hypothetical protein K9K30_06030 [Burkholderiaceae bacterium]|nr:hypothetical protein [Sulfuritalea sp.]MCF8174783.1 hypothetical protein [Burkholderiaceae bacterium]MCF8184394.1 hypothetical protein [Polynucleobacter sp.]
MAASTELPRLLPIHSVHRLKGLLRQAAKSMQPALDPVAGLPCYWPCASRFLHCSYTDKSAKK